MKRPNESRPAANHEAARSFPGDYPNSSAVHRKTWARELIDRATRPIQSYGSPEWCALPLDHPNRVAAVVVAAEAWAWDWENLEDNLRREVEEMRAAFKREEDAEYARSAAEHRKTMERKYGRVLSSFEERRARQLEAAKPRLGDFPGRNNGGAA
jgi:pimeloyl-ACP methyl ester carboxylesterase